MERKNLALLCAGVVCFWLFALAFGTAQGSGLRRQSPAVQTAVQPQGPVQPAAAQPALELPCRAACLIDQQTGTILYEKNADHTVACTTIHTLVIGFQITPQRLQALVGTILVGKLSKHRADCHHHGEIAHHVRAQTR